MATMLQHSAHSMLGRRVGAAMLRRCSPAAISRPMQRIAANIRPCRDGSPAGADLSDQPLASARRHSHASSSPGSTSAPHLAPQSGQLPIGRVDIIIGPMFAGKSTELLRRVRQEQQSGYSTALVKSAVDTRYAVNHVCTHTGDQLPCSAVERLLPLLSDAAFMAHDVIAIDEAQFFPDLLEFAVAAAESHAKRLIIAGLDGDYKRLKFGHMLELVPLADSVTKLTGKCNYCDARSIHSFRVVADERQQLVGGGDMYVPTCRFHYVSLSKHRNAQHADLAEQS